MRTKEQQLWDGLTPEEQLEFWRSMNATERTRFMTALGGNTGLPSMPEEHAKRAADAVEILPAIAERDVRRRNVRNRALIGAVVGAVGGGVVGVACFRDLWVERGYAPGQWGGCFGLFLGAAVVAFICSKSK